MVSYFHLHRADIPNCYDSIYRPLPHLRVWYSRCICGHKSSHLSPPLSLDRLAGLSMPSMPRPLWLPPGIIPNTRGISFATLWYRLTLIWADIPNCRRSVYRPLPRLLVWYSRSLSTLIQADSPNYPVMSPLTPHGLIAPTIRW